MAARDKIAHRFLSHTTTGKSFIVSNVCNSHLRYLLGSLQKNAFIRLIVSLFCIWPYIMTGLVNSGDTGLAIFLKMAAFAILDLCGRIWTTLRVYLIVLITVQNLVVIDEVFR